ncbi:MAG: trehalose-phosphatase [Shimia sp.]
MLLSPLVTAGPETLPPPPTLASQLPRPSETLLCLDFDGTLVDIAPTPDAIRIPAGLPALLRRLHDATGGAVALVSGRRLDDLDAFLPGFPGPIVAVHGAEWRWPGGEVQRHPLAGAQAVRRLNAAMHIWSDLHPGTRVEAKACGGVLHYREAPEHAEAALSAMRALADRADGLALHEAKMALEIGPADVSKGGGLARLMSAHPGRRPLAIGDDRTDETMFRPALAAGGTAIKIGDGPSAAPHRLPDPAALRATLSEWVGD